MRFGLFVPQGWRLDLAGIEPAKHWETMLEVARAAEDGPFESVWVYDHFHTVPVPTEEATHEAWTLMAALGAATRRVRLGQMCTCMGYRNPAHLAKVAATVDVVSGGRTEMGIGAGWYEHEWRAYGYGFPPAGERLAMLDEGAGTDFSPIVRSGNYNVIIAETESEVDDRLAWLRSHYAPYLPEDRVERTIQNLRSGPLVGTPEQIVERLTEASGLGMTYAILYLPEIAYDRAGFRLLADKVIPELAGL
jgi:alkanesulfonate monooxygenase SsuD/methylene tetrahydromethanopterin reductase-like flavin-dependent oxidoreductase (luciferase family)